jgi:hypothetical protein
MVNPQPYLAPSQQASQFPLGHSSSAPPPSIQRMLTMQPTLHAQNTNSWSVNPPPQHDYPSYLDMKWYFSESIRQSARDLHSRVYIPPNSAPDPERFDAMFRPIITTSVEWAEPFGPYLAVRMWRWTGWFAPYKQGLVVEKFLGRFGLRDQRTVSSVLAYKGVDTL